MNVFNLTFKQPNVYTREELTEMFESAGLKVIETYGSFGGEPFTNESERLIMIGNKIRS